MSKAVFLIFVFLGTGQVFCYWFEELSESSHANALRAMFFTSFSSPMPHVFNDKLGTEFHSYRFNVHLLGENGLRRSVDQWNYVERFNELNSKEMPRAPFYTGMAHSLATSVIYGWAIQMIDSIRNPWLNLMKHNFCFRGIETIVVDRQKINYDREFGPSELAYEVSCD